MLHKCFRKIGTKKERINEEHERMYNQWKTLKNKEDIESIAERMNLEEMLAEDYVKKIQDAHMLILSEICSLELLFHQNDPI